RRARGETPHFCSSGCRLTAEARGTYPPRPGPARLPWHDRTRADQRRCSPAPSDMTGGAMRISERVPVIDLNDLEGPGPPVAWPEETRHVLTRELLVRASRAPHGEGQALRFRALHLNLPLIGDVAGHLGLADADRARVEHAALEGLHEAVRLYD